MVINPMAQVNTSNVKTKFRKLFFMILWKFSADRFTLSQVTEKRKIPHFPC